MEWDRTNKRRALVWGAWGAVLLVGLAGLFAWHSIESYEAALRKFELYVGSTDPRDYARSPVPDEQNVALNVAAAAAAIEIGTEWSRTLEPVVWSAATETAARDVIEANRPALNALQGATELPSCVWPALPFVGMDSLRPMLGAARLTRLEGFVAIADGDQNRVRQSFGVLGRLADCLYAQPHLLGALVAASVERSQLDVVHAAVSSAATSTALLEHLRAELERSSRVDRVRWALAGEGALALLLLEEERPRGLVGRSGRTLFSRRIGAALALRWVEFAAWSEKSLEEVLGEPVAEPKSDHSVAGLVADMAILNLRHTIVSLRTNRALIGLARIAIDGRLYARRNGSYSDAFRNQTGLDVLLEMDGSALLIDSRLETLLRAYQASADQSGTPEAESILDLTVWRLPPPEPARRKL